MTKYTKNVAWMEEFVNSVADIAPIQNIKRVAGYKVKLGLSESQEAAIHVANDRATKFIITIKLYDQETKEGVTMHKPMHLARVLDSLAHEISHLVYWQHEPNHLKLQAIILRRFVLVLKKHKVDDTYESFKKYYK